MKYWHSIPKAVRESRIIVYPYRLWPVCDVLQPLSEEMLTLIKRKEKKAPQKNLGKLSEPFDPDNWTTEVAQRWGAGDYHLVMNDVHPSVKKTICQTITNGEYPLRDFDRYPPVLNPAEIVMTDEKNKPYIRWCQINKIKLPGDTEFDNPTGDGEQEDMALQSTIEKLVDNTIQFSKEAKAAAAAQPAQSLDAHALRESISIVSAGATAQIEQMKETSKLQQEAMAKAADPMLMLDKVGGIIEKFIPKGSGDKSGPDPMITFLMQKMELDAKAASEERQRQHERHERELKAAEDRRKEEREYQQKQMDILREELKAARTEQQSNKGILGGLKEIGLVRDGLEALGLTGGSGDDGLPTWARIASKAMDVVPPMLANTVHNIAAMKAGARPAPPPDINSEFMEEVEDVSQPVIGGGSAPQQQANATGGNSQMFAGIQQQIQQLKPHLIGALQQKAHGHEFAAWLILQGQQHVYTQLSGLGADMITGGLKMIDPQLGQFVSKIGPQWSIFLNEFLDQGMVREAVIAMQSSAAPQPQPAVAIVQEGQEVDEQQSRTVMGPNGKPIKTKPPVSPQQQSNGPVVVDSKPA